MAATAHQTLPLSESAPGDEPPQYSSLFSMKDAYTQLTLFDRNPLSGHNKVREVYRATPEARKFLKTLLASLAEVLPISENAVGSIKGMSPIEVVDRHRSSRYFYCIDIQNAYGQIDPERLASMVDSAVFDEMTGDELIDWCCFEPDDDKTGLIPGLPTSPYLFNAYLYPLDLSLAQIAADRELIYTRYLDDLTFSSPSSPIDRKLRAEIRAEIEQFGLPIQHSKTRLYDLDRGPIVLNGIQLNPDGSWALPTRAFAQYAASLLTGDTSNLRQRAAGVRGMLVNSRDPYRLGGIQTDAYYALMRKAERRIRNR